jgi:hypothetical protein
MALIKCLECGREVSDKAPVCLGCGAPIAGAVAVQPKGAQASPASLLDLVNPLNGSTYKANVDPQTLMALNGECQDDRDYESWIDRLGGLHPMLKDVFKGLVKFSVTAGKVIFHMGKVILNFVMKLVREFSHTIAGIVAGFVIGMIFSSIPLIGWALGGLVTPLLMACGGIAGFMEDMSRKAGNADLEKRIRSSVIDNLGALGLNF